MNDAERKIILARMKKAQAQTKIMSRDEARKRLVDEGFYDEHGRLSAHYGGKVAARA